MTPIEQFVSHISSQTPYRFSDRVEKAYSEIIEWMKTEPHMSGFNTDREKPELSDGTPYGVSRQFFWYFQTHNTKAYHSLLALSNANIKQGEISWLDKPVLSILDIGAGTGAATVALLDLLCSYYKYRWENGYVVYPRTISIAAIEPSKSALNVLKRFLNILKPELEYSQIYLKFMPIIEEFPHPECINLIKKKWRPNNSHTLMAISSNVIFWTYCNFNRYTAWLKYFGIEEKKTNLGEAEAKVFQDLLTHYKFKQILLLDIATRQIKNQSLFALLSEKINDFIKSFSSTDETIQWWKIEAKTSVNFLNAHQTAFGQSHGGQRVETDYFHSLRGATYSLSDSDLPWQRTIENKNLELAWIRSRYYMLHDDLVDEIEIRLTDFFYQSYLERLRNYLIFDLYDILNINECISYAGVKNLNDNRPRYLLRIGEQIVSSSLSQSNPKAFEPISEYVFGNRLNKEKNEFFYESWFKHFDAYAKSINKISEADYVTWKLDIKSFYTNISQNILYNKLCHDIGVQKRSQLQGVINRIIVRNLCRPYHKGTSGLPQSGITAGLWANNYLQDLDVAMFQRENKNDIYFYRYADDMTIVAKENDMNSIVNQIQKVLKDPLQLELNHTKTQKNGLRAYKKNPHYEILGKRSKYLMNSLYRIPTEYKQAKAHNCDLFLREYEHLLGNIGIFLPDLPYWLNRKIYQMSLIKEKTIYNLKKLTQSIITVEFPKYKLGMSEQDKKRWNEAFQSSNPKWFKERDLIRSELSQFFIENMKIFKNSQGETQTQARRAMRFSAYRLSWFGVHQIAQELEDILICSPWTLSSRIVLKSLIDIGFSRNVLNLAIKWHGRKIPCGINDKREIVTGMECSHSLCASACRAMSYGRLTDEIETFLWAVLFSKESHLVEQIAASDSLLRFNAKYMGQYEKLIELSKQKKEFPYLVKNIVLLIALSKREGWEDAIIQIGNYNPHMIVTDAIQFAILSNGNKSIFDVEEPQIITKYYSKHYSDFPFQKHSSP